MQNPFLNVETLVEIRKNEPPAYFRRMPDGTYMRMRCPKKPTAKRIEKHDDVSIPAMTA